MMKKISSVSHSCSRRCFDPFSIWDSWKIDVGANCYSIFSASRDAWKWIWKATNTNLHCHNGILMRIHSRMRSLLLAISIWRFPYLKTRIDIAIKPDWIFIRGIFDIFPTLNRLRFQFVNSSSSSPGISHFISPLASGRILIPDDARSLAKRARAQKERRPPEYWWTASKMSNYLAIKILSESFHISGEIDSWCRPMLPNFLPAKLFFSLRLFIFLCNKPRILARVLNGNMSGWEGPIHFEQWWSRCESHLFLDHRIQT